MEKSLELGSEYRTKDGGGLAFKVVSDTQAVCVDSAPHWSNFFAVGHLYSFEENGNVVTGDTKIHPYCCKPWVTLRQGGKILT